MKLVKDPLIQDLQQGRIEPEAAVQTALERNRVSRSSYVPQKKEDLKARYMSDREIRQKAIQASVPFIHRGFSPNYRLTQGLILVGALSGKSKSTTAANVVAGFLDHSSRRAIVINNEELAGDAYDRISCIQLKTSFDRYRQGKLGTASKEEIQDQSGLLMDRVEVIAGDTRYDMTAAEDVISVLEYAADQKDVGLIVLDYYQTVSHSKENFEWDSYRVLKYVGDFLREYGRRSVVPVVVFAQLKPKSDAADMQSRIQNDRTIYNQAFSVIEIRPDFETMVTTFEIHKDRYWGNAGREIQMRYVDGRYEPVGEDSL